MRVNLKRIGAIVAGATILASSVAFAGLMYQNTELVNDNGAPQAKVVVGANAAASDGIAAANIAAKLASEAFRVRSVTASVSGEASCGGGDDSGGSCELVNPTVDLEITVPGGADSPGTYTINTYLGDYLNRELLDRDYLTTAASQNYTGSSDTVDDANPFTNGSTSGFLNSVFASKARMYRVTGTQFSDLSKDKTLDDPDVAGSAEYSENENLWIEGQTYFDTSNDATIADVNFLAYTLKFKGPGSSDFGIPVCSEIDATGTANNWHTCANSKQTDTHQLKVKFLGSNWLISDMTPPTAAVANLSSETLLAAGGSVTLAKESLPTRIINVGQATPDTLSGGAVEIHLIDVETNPSTGTSSAVFRFVSGDTEVTKSVAEGSTDDVTIGDTTYKVHVFDAVAGQGFLAAYAEYSVFASELKLESGQQLDVLNSANKGWRVYLGWKNRGAGASGDNGRADHLRTIVIYTPSTDADSPVKNDLKIGQYAEIVKSPAAWKLSYLGLEDVERDNLMFQVHKGTNEQLGGYVYNTSTTQAADCNITAPYVTVSSTVDGAFTFTGNNSLSPSYRQFYIATSGVACTGLYAGATRGDVIMRISKDSNYYEYQSYPTATNHSLVNYELAGEGRSITAGGAIYWADSSNTTSSARYADRVDAAGPYFANLGLGITNTTTTGSLATWMFGLVEKAGEGTSNSAVDRVVFGLNITNSNQATFKFDNGSHFAKEYAWYQYTGPHPYARSSWQSVDVSDKFTTERGSIINGKGDDKVTIEVVRNKVAKDRLQLVSSGTQTTETGAQLVTMGLDEEQTFSGVKVKVVGFSQDSCTVSGGAVACGTPDMTGVGATLFKDGTQVAGDSLSLAEVTPYSSYGPLVVLDSDAATTGTMILIGGDLVNSKTAEVLEGTEIDFSDPETSVVVQEVEPGKIVVAGLTAEDTLQAAQEFIAALE